ncbi:atrial natriuretic peptide receptor 3-like [Limulus polyphemus]|uniref:Atrial natriuretic peptide receptor 3-like n=1 Tax=Limulus polyphemus TaxID=6850 RepID=A0ABM1C4V5_LIMPO|nr:atrial natriuretic peptide receptor 3-like [Limulus polyphemus]
MGDEDLSDYLVTYDHWSNDTVRVSVLLPNDSLYLGAIPRVGPAIELAIQKIQDQGTLPEWKWQVKYRDTKCSTSDGPMQAFRAFTEQRLHVFFGPYCDYVIAPIARLLKFWNVPMLTAGALARDYGFDKSTFDKEFYLLTRTGLSFNGVTSFLLAIFRRFDWQNVLITYEELARPQIAREDYCVLLTKALVAEFRLLGNFSFQPFKLKSNISAAESRNVLKKEVGTKYGGAFGVTIHAIFFRLAKLKKVVVFSFRFFFGETIHAISFRNASDWQS